MHTPLPQACIAITVQHAVSVATCLGSALIAAKSAPQPSASPSALKLIVSGSCEWPEPVELREVCGEFVEGRLFSRLAATAAVTAAHISNLSPRERARSVRAAVLVAKRDIAPGEEIFVWYGTDKPLAGGAIVAEGTAGQGRKVRPRLGERRRSVSK